MRTARLGWRGGSRVITKRHKRQKSDLLYGLGFVRRRRGSQNATLITDQSSDFETMAPYQAIIHASNNSATMASDAVCHLAA
jgi:hypothetical protein